MRVTRTVSRRVRRVLDIKQDLFYFAYIRSMARTPQSHPEKPPTTYNSVSAYKQRF